MPATVRISESARLGLRVALIILAAVVLLVPIVVTTAHGASRLDYGRIETDEALPQAMKELTMNVDNGAAVEIRTAEVDEPSVTLTATGPRDSSSGLNVRTRGDAAEVALGNRRKLENTRITVTVASDESAELKLDIDGDYGTFDITGDYAGVSADTGGGALHVNGSADQVRTSTDWGATYLSGTFGTVESKTGVGALEAENLTVRDRLDAVTSTGTLELDFTNEAIPADGIIAKTEEGSIDLRLPNLELAQENMADEAADDGEKKEKAEEFFYRINAKSNDGTVDLAHDLDEYDVAHDPKGAEGKTLVPVSATADTGMVTVNQN